LAATTFSSLRIRNYRIYLIGQSISLCGTWMQRIAQAWLVLELTGSGTAVGAVTALQYVPIMLLAPWGGVIADRYDKRRILYVTQTVIAISAVVLGVLVLTDVIELWMVYLSALTLGLSSAFDTPTRQTFVLEMVGRDNVTNAVSLHSTLVNAARVVGPAIAGLIIVFIGIGWCFVIDGISYLGLVIALLLMNPGELHLEETPTRTPNQLVEGLRYVMATPAVRTPLILLAVAGLFAYEYQVILPLFARFTFGGDARTFSWLTSAMGVGAVAGGLAVASRANRPPVALARTGLVFGGLQLLTSLTPSLPLALAGLAVLGAASVSFIAIGNSTLQLTAAPGMRGRVMGLYVVAFLGTTPLGGPLMGWIGEHLGPRLALAGGGLAVLIASTLALPGLREMGGTSPIGYRPNEPVRSRPDDLA
jgi:MFS family permease